MFYKPYPYDWLYKYLEPLKKSYKVPQEIKVVNDVEYKEYKEYKFSDGCIPDIPVFPISY